VTLDVSVVIPCLGRAPHLRAAVESVQAQTHAAVETVVVRTAETDPWAFARLPLGRIRLVTSEGTSPGAVCNVGVAASHGDLVMVLEPNDLLPPCYLERATAALAEESDLDFVTSWTAPAGEITGNGAPASCDVPTVIGRSDSIHRSALFRRRLWEALEGFDEALPGWWSYDFWLRALQRGYRGRIIPEPFWRRQPSGEPLHDQTLDRGLWRESLQALVEKHSTSLRAYLAASIGGRERRLQELQAHQRSLARRIATVEHEAAQARAGVARATERLQALGQERFEWGDFRRATPISPVWGADRGQCIDRYYIEQFLEAHRADIAGTVLEVHDDDYTRQFGGSRVRRADVLDIEETNPRATVIADLRHADAIPSDTYDCFIMTQTLHVIDDMRRALAECVRILKPGGVLLATLPCVSRVAAEQGLDADFWRFTEAAARRLFGEFFDPDRLEVRAYGNILVMIAYLYGLTSAELSPEEFEVHDPYFPLLVSVRATTKAWA
jgi:SAM-dependent methyltransferase